MSWCASSLRAPRGSFFPVHTVILVSRDDSRLPNWCADITYNPDALRLHVLDGSHGLGYAFRAVVAAVELHGRGFFCLDALDGALWRSVALGIFNTEQCS